MPNKFPILVGASTPEPTSGDYLVRFIDFDGTILKEQWVNSGQNATAPTPPTHSLLTFNSWNNTFTNVTRNIDVGAIYDNIDDKTYLFCTFTPITGLQPSITFNKPTTALLTIDWGDGSTSTTTTSGNQSIQKPIPYSAGGNYLITLSSAGTYNFYTILFGNTAYQRSLTKAYINVTSLGINAFYLANCLRTVSITENCLTIASNGFYDNWALYCLNVPRSVTSIGNSCFTNNYSLKYLNFSSTSITLGSALMLSCSSLLRIDYTNATIADSTQMNQSNLSLIDVIFGAGITTLKAFTFFVCAARRAIVLPTTITSIEASVFGNNYSCISYQVLATTPPTLANISAFAGITPIAKIYVPDASVAAYQSATNWVTYKNYIYPISELAEYAGTIFFQCNGGNAIKQIQGTVGEVATQPTAPTKSGFTFDGWYKDAALTTAWNWASDVYPATNLTLYAKWV